MLIKIRRAAICGTDLHIYHWNDWAARNYTLPLVLGHEFCGTIEAIGPEVTQLREGDRVTADPNIGCGFCSACRAGRVNLCENLQAIGVTRDGGFAQYVTIPQTQALRLPASLDPLLGAFSEPLACCLHGLDVAAIKPGDTVAVLGGGVIGLLMVELARLAGASRVMLSTRQAARRTLALKVGATDVINPSTGDPVEAMRAVAPDGVDVALECAGVPETFRQSLAAVRRGGTAVLFGVMAKGQTVEVEPFDLLFREVRLLPAYLNPHTHRRAAQMIADGVLDLDPLISRTIGLEELPGELAAEPRQGDVKVMVRPGR